MKKYINSVLVCCAVAWGFSACTDVWDEHYQANKPVTGQTTNADDNLWNLISNAEDLKEFTALLKATKCDSLLMYNRSYTVWAPVDGSGFIDTSLLKNATNEELAVYKKKIVENHIADYSHSAGGIRDKENKKDYKKVEMLNLKKYDFEGKKAGEYTFNGKGLKAANILAKNGILHKVDGYVEFNANIWEQLEIAAEESNISKLWNFLKKDYKLTFDPVNSVQGPVEDGQVTWLDSMFTVECRWFQELGKLNLEDSLYTMYALTDDVWDEMLDMTKSYFQYDSAMVTLPAKGSLNREDAIDSIAKNLMCRNLVFSQTVNKKFFDGVSDTARSTRYQIFKGEEATALRETAKEAIELSNGSLCFIDENNFRDIFNPFELWHDTLRVEGESLSDADETRLGFRYAYKTVESIDRDSLLYDSISGHAVGVYQAASGQNMELRFYVNNVLSSWYRIRIVLLPRRLLDPTDTLLTKPNKFVAQLFDGATAGDLLGDIWISDSSRIDTITLAEAYEVKKCEYDLKSLSGGTPGLNLCIRSEIDLGTGAFNKKEGYGIKNDKNWKYDPDFRVDQVIFEPIEAPTMASEE